MPQAVPKRRWSDMLVELIGNKLRIKPVGVACRKKIGVGSEVVEGKPMPVMSNDVQLVNKKPKTQT